MQRKQVPVNELQYGMYVAELDRPWTETPFMYQGFHLNSEQQLATLKKLCKHVFVDPERTSAPEKRGPFPAANFKIRGTARYPQTAPVETEFRQAHVVYSQSVTQVGELLKPVSQPGGVLDVKEVKDSVTRLTDSVVRNPDALLLVTRLREKSQHAHARALQVSIYMIVFARFLDLEREELELLGLLGLLQDIGKTRLPAAVLEKQGALTPEESELAKKHVEYSAEILRETPGIPARLPALALLHHERQDGTGYPKGLKGDAIGLYGSVAARAGTLGAVAGGRRRHLRCADGRAALRRGALALERAQLLVQGARRRLPPRAGRAVHPV